MSRTTAVLIAILAAQLVIWGVASTSRQVVKTKPKFLSVDTSQVDYVHIKNEDGEVTLRRIGGNWKVAEPFDYPANASYIQTLLEKLADLKLESFITGSRDKWVDFELDTAKAEYVEIGKEGKPVDKFYCGKPNKTYTHTYMRKAASNDVWLVTGTPRSSFTRRPKDWRDKNIVELDRTTIEKIVLKHPDEVVQLVRKVTTADGADTTWEVVPEKGAPFASDEQIMNRILNTASKLRALDFLDGATDTIPNFDKPDLAVEIYLEGGRREFLEFVPQPKQENRWVVRKNRDTKTYFVVYQSSVKNLRKKPADLKPGAKEPEA